MFSMNDVRLISNVKAFLTNVVMFSMNEIKLISNVKAFLTNVVMVSMDGLVLLMSGSFAKAIA